MKLVHLVGFIIKKFVMMHDHTKVKKEVFHYFIMNFEIIGEWHFFGTKSFPCTGIELNFKFNFTLPPTSNLHKITSSSTLTSGKSHTSFLRIFMQLSKLTHITGEDFL